MSDDKSEQRREQGGTGARGATDAAPARRHLDNPGVDPGGDDTAGVERDARGQSESNHAGGSNSGMSSARPRVISHDEGGDATFPWPKQPGKPSPDGT